MGGLHFWWPKMTGRMYSESAGRTAAIMLFVGFNLTFFPQFILGYEGMPRRYPTYAPEFQVLNVMSTAGASILAVGYALPFFYLIWSLKNGRIAGRNPWRATGLEWQTSSPPTTFNFDRTPVVTVGPYMYSPEADEILDAQLAVEQAHIDLERTRAEIAQHHTGSEEAGRGV
jgi:cytochrome c oxidase subunit 1